MGSCVSSFFIDIKDFCYQTEEAFYQKYCLGYLVLFLCYVMYQLHKLYALIVSRVLLCSVVILVSIIKVIEIKCVNS